jgi:fructose-bisphosphate aldolase class II
VIHIVLFEAKLDAAEEDVARLVTEARAKLTQIPGVSNLRAGWVTQADSPWRVVLSMEFEDEAGLESYRTHPLHVDYVENVIRPVEERRFVVDFEE